MSKELLMLRQAARAASAKKAVRMVIMDLRGQSDICDFQLVCSGDNDRQTRAIAESLEQTLKKEFQMIPAAVEGKAAGQWIVIDYGFFIAHVFFNPVRDYYAIEQIWPKAKLLSPADLN